MICAGPVRPNSRVGNSRVGLGNQGLPHPGPSLRAQGPLLSAGQKVGADASISGRKNSQGPPPQALHLKNDKVKPGEFVPLLKIHKPLRRQIKGLPLTLLVAGSIFLKDYKEEGGTAGKTSWKSLLP